MFKLIMSLAEKKLNFFEIIFSEFISSSDILPLCQSASGHYLHFVEKKKRFDKVSFDASS